MTRRSVEKITCPNCHKESDFLLYDTVNVTLNPELKKDLLENNFSVFSCPFCQVDTRVESSLLYHDMEKHLWFQYVPDAGQIDSYIEKFEEFLNISEGMFKSTPYQIRFLLNKQHLIEKIRIFDAGYDDRVIECMKVYLAVSAEEEGIAFRDIFFDEDDYYVFVFVNDEGIVAATEFSEELYEHILKTYPNVQKSKSYFYNSQWASKIIFED